MEVDAPPTTDGLLRGSGDYRIERWLAGDTPAVTVRPSGVTDRLPAVLVYHGFAGDKTGDLLRMAMPLADAGCLAVLPDAALHGERAPKDFDGRLQSDRDGLFLDCLSGTVAEATGLLEWVVGREDVDAGRIGVVGISMGGAVALDLACRGRPRPPGAAPKVAVALMPALVGPGSAIRQEVAYAPDAASCFPTALMIVHGTEDHLAPYPTARSFYDGLVPHYSEAPERLRFLSVPGDEHRVGPYWTEETLAWIGRFL